MRFDEYQTVTGTSEGLYKEKGSKFLAFVFPVKNEDEVKEILQELRKSHHDARHHCYAWAFGPKRDQYRTNDDGEPSGTAGKPIFGQILSFNVTDILIVVIRYFGGTKLGVSGLINAYRQAAKEALDVAVIEVKTIQKIIRIAFEYPLMNDVMRIIKETEPLILNQTFELSCSMELSIRESDYGHLLNRFELLHGITILS